MLSVEIQELGRDTIDKYRYTDTMYMYVLCTHTHTHTHTSARERRGDNRKEHVLRRYSMPCSQGYIAPRDQRLRQEVTPSNSKVHVYFTISCCFLWEEID